MNEITWRHSATAKTVYATIRAKYREMWNTAGTPAFEALTVANWANYVIALTETPASSYFYVGDWPAALTTVDWYWVDLYEQIEAGPSIHDPLIGGIIGYWDGTDLMPWAADTVTVSGVPQDPENIVGAFVELIGVPTDLGSGATIAANLVDIENQTDDIGVAGAGLTAFPQMPAAFLSEITAQYGVETRIAFIVGNKAGTGGVTGLVFGSPFSGVCYLITLTGATLITNVAAHPAGQGFYIVTLSAAQMQFKHALLVIKESTGALGRPVYFSITTYGNEAAAVTSESTLLIAIAGVPTVAEFEARTLVAADYTVVSDLPTGIEPIVLPA